MSDRPNRPWRVMVKRGFRYRYGWVDLPKPKCAGTYTTRERAEGSMSPRWARDAGAYIEGPNEA